MNSVASTSRNAHRVERDLLKRAIPSFLFFLPGLDVSLHHGVVTLDLDLFEILKPYTDWGRRGGWGRSATVLKVFRLGALALPPCAVQ